MCDDLDKCIVLIVDDTPMNIDILVDTLGDDYEMRVALDGETALKDIHEFPPDIILLDVMMPGMSGYDLCEKLKADKKTSNIPIIFITSKNDDKDEEIGLKLGAVDFITKPFNPELVKARVHNQVELKRYRDTLEVLVKQRTKELQSTQEATILAMAVVAERRDNETGNHIKATQYYVRLLAEYLKNNDKFAELKQSGVIDLLVMSAPLHDIGKVGIPDNILCNPGKLTQEEFEEMKKHSVYGYESIREVEKILGYSSFLKFAGEIAVSHHERYDGKGYPYGLRGDEIPISGRIMAVADVYDALVSKRIYKPPFNHKAAIRIITDGRGTQFDPDVVDAFIALKDDFQKVHSS